MIEPVRIGDDVTLYLGDCLEVIDYFLPDNSVDALCADPPAGINFMGKDWDKDKGGRDAWITWMTTVAAECLRVLKPGGHALVWALPRTSHWTATAWENAGFEVRDRVSHLFGSGFPKSRDVSKAIDSEAGAEREVVGVNQAAVRNPKRNTVWTGDVWGDNGATITAPATPEAQQWDGWGSALKPAMEDWWLLRKPLSEKTIAANVLKWGTGALNIDGCRVGAEENYHTHAIGTWSKPDTNNAYGKGLGQETSPAHPEGRWPAQLVHDGSDEVLAGFPETTSGAIKAGQPAGRDMRAGAEDHNRNGGRPVQPRDVSGSSGSAARFFYCAKPSKAERNAGLDDFYWQKDKTRQSGYKRITFDEWTALPKEERAQGNIHSTVKCIELMKHLLTLITPPGGVVLDAFMGSGSTGKAAVALSYPFIGIDNDPDYFDIAEARISVPVQKELL